MDDPTDLALGILTGVSLAVCFGCVVGHIIRDMRKSRMKPSKSDTNLSLNNKEEPVVVYRRDTDPEVDF